MAEKLVDRIGHFNSLSIIGMCKNAGKTTVLGRIIRELWDDGHTLALTSIGRDGEASDLVTGTKKPGIYVREGTLTATASKLLRHCDATREILETTGISTPLGEVVVLRALSDGNVQLAGPSIVRQLVRVSEIFTHFGAQKIIIDGAISRKTLCSRRLSDATVLCTGASCGKSMDEVVEETAFFCKVLGLPPADDDALAAALEAHPGAEAIIMEDAGTRVIAKKALSSALKAGGVRTAYISGAASQGIMDPIATSGVDIRGVIFAVDDASKIMINRQTWEKLTLKGAQMKVLDSVNLRAVTVNPFSAYGYHFEPKEFAEKMARATPVPVIDVMRC